MARPRPFLLLHNKRMLIGRHGRRLNRRVGQSYVPLGTLLETQANLI